MSSSFRPKSLHTAGSARTQLLDHHMDLQLIVGQCSFNGDQIELNYLCVTLLKTSKNYRLNRINIWRLQQFVLPLGLVREVPWPKLVMDHPPVRCRVLLRQPERDDLHCGPGGVLGEQVGEHVVELQYVEQGGALPRRHLLRQPPPPHPPPRHPLQRKEHLRISL